MAARATLVSVALLMLVGVHAQSAHFFICNLQLTPLSDLGCSSQCDYKNLQAGTVDPTSGSDAMKGILNILTVMSESVKGFSDIPRWAGYMGSGVFQNFFDVRSPARHHTTDHQLLTHRQLMSFLGNHNGACIGWIKIWNKRWTTWHAS